MHRLIQANRHSKISLECKPIDCSLVLLRKDNVHSEVHICDGAHYVTIKS